MSYSALINLIDYWSESLLDRADVIEELKYRKGINDREVFTELKMGVVVPAPEELPSEIEEYLNDFGLLEEYLIGMVSLPIRNYLGRIENIVFINLSGNNPVLLNDKGIINLEAFWAFKEILFVDTLEDFFTGYISVKKNVVPVLDTGMIEDIINALKWNDTERIYLLNTSSRYEDLKEKLAGTDITCISVTLPDELPLREYIKRWSVESFLNLLESESEKKILSDTSAVPEDFILVETERELLFKAIDRAYRIRGFIREGFEKLVMVSLEIDGMVVPDKVDLSRSLSRYRFAELVSTEVDISIDTVKKDLNKIYALLDEIQNEAFSDKLNVPDKNITVITPGEKSKILDAVSKRDILNELLLEDTERLGYVGEEVNKKLFYLSATSRLTGRPVSVLDISPSGTGKSFGLSMIMDLMPPEDVLRYSRLSPNALYYMTEADLKGKVLCIEEICGMEESLEPIRMLLSAGELAVSVVEKDAVTGSLKTVERRIRVDIPVLSSGVKDIFDEETMSRFIITYNDLTESHRNRILESIGRAYSLEGEKIYRGRKEILTFWRKLQRTFDTNLRVVNPFTDRITLNVDLPVITRKLESYYRLLNTIAFVRQVNKTRYREVDSKGKPFEFITVDKSDIDTANEIASYVFKYSRSDLTKRLYDACMVIKKYCTDSVKDKRISPYDVTFTRREIREYTGWKLSMAKDLLDKLEELEYIYRVSGSRGKMFLYRLLPFDDKEIIKTDLNLPGPFVDTLVPDLNLRT